MQRVRHMAHPHFFVQDLLFLDVFPKRFQHIAFLNKLRL